MTSSISLVKSAVSDLSLFELFEREKRALRIGEIAMREGSAYVSHWRTRRISQTANLTVKRTSYDE